MLRNVLSVTFDALPKDAQALTSACAQWPVQVRDASGRELFFIVSPKSFWAQDSGGEVSQPLPEAESAESGGRVPFYAIVYSPSRKVMALTGKRTFMGYTEQALCNDYPYWTQAKSNSEPFKQLAEATDRRAEMMVDYSEEEVASRVIQFLEDGYSTASHFKPFIKRRLHCKKSIL